MLSLMKGLPPQSVNHHPPQSGQSKRKVCFAIIPTCLLAFACSIFSISPAAALLCRKLLSKAIHTVLSLKSLGFMLSSFHVLFQRFLCIHVARVLLLRKRIQQKSQPPPISVSVVRECVFRRGVRHIGYTCGRMGNEKYQSHICKREKCNWVFNIQNKSYMCEFQT